MTNKFTLLLKRTTTISMQPSTVSSAPTSLTCIKNYIKSIVTDHCENPPNSHKNCSHLLAITIIKANDSKWRANRYPSCEWLLCINKYTYWLKMLPICYLRQLKTFIFLHDIICWSSTNSIHTKIYKRVLWVRSTRMPRRQTTWCPLMPSFLLSAVAFYSLLSAVALYSLLCA